VPWWAISSRFQPAPTPKSNRPPERTSIEATSFAVMIRSPEQPGEWARGGDYDYWARGSKPSAPSWTPARRWRRRSRRDDQRRERREQHDRVAQAGESTMCLRRVRPTVSPDHAAILVE